jgi:hypothetical protein
MPDAPDDADANPYVIGEASARRQDYATFEFKAPDPNGRGGRGGGYPRWRSWEGRPETSRRGKEDVYVPVHRLAAVAWCLPDGDLGTDVTLAALDGVDVHHTTGMKAATIGESPNFEGPGLELVAHARHAEITQTELRTRAERARQQAADASGYEGGVSERDRTSVCARCGDETTTLCASPDFDGQRCPECAAAAGGDAAIKVVD